jgi:hypothetical protein
MRAASLAMFDLRWADRFAARALPPLEAPSFESATAAGFFFLFFGGFAGITRLRL